MNFRWVDNSQCLSGAWKQGKAVSKEDIHPPSQLRVGVTSEGGNRGPTQGGGGHPEGLKNATKSPQIKHSSERQQTLIATTLCADLNYLATNPSLA